MAILLLFARSRCVFCGRAVATYMIGPLSPPGGTPPGKRANARGGQNLAEVCSPVLQQRSGLGYAFCERSATVSLACWAVAHSLTACATYCLIPRFETSRCLISPHLAPDFDFEIDFDLI